MSRVNRNHRTPAFFGLIRNKGSELGKRPTMDTAGSDGLSDLASFSDVGQTFDHNRAAWLNRTNNLFTQDMIAVASETGLARTNSFQVPLGASRALPLQGAFQVKLLAFNCFPRLFAQEVIVGCNSGSHDTQVNTRNLLSWCHVRSWNGDNNMQPPGAMSKQQIGGISRIACPLRAVVRNREADCLTACDGTHPNRATLPIYTVGMHVVARWAGVRVWHVHLGIGLFAFRLSLHGKCTLECFRCFDSCLNHQITHQRWVFELERVIGRMVQRHTIRYPRIPSMFTHGIKRSRKQSTGFLKRVGLRVRGVQLYP